MRVTAILLNYRRPYNLPRIVESLARHDFIDQCVIWNNGEPDVLAETIPETRLDMTVIDSRENLCTFGRYRAAEYAKNEILYFQDDDCIVNRVQEMYERFLANVGAITAGLPPGHYLAEVVRSRTPWLQLGWASFHKIEWLDCVHPWIDRWGVDELLMRKFDRIYTSLFGRHDPLELREGLDFERLRGPDGRLTDRDANALYLRNDHVVKTKEAMDRVRELQAGAHV